MVGEDWSGQDLTEYSFSESSFTGANMSGCDLQGCDLSGSEFTGVNFSGSDLQGADLSGSALSGVNFANADLEGADFQNCSLVGVNFSNADLGGADFTDAQHSGCNFNNADVDGAIGLNVESESFGRTVNLNTIDVGLVYDGMGNMTQSGNGTQSAMNNSFNAQSINSGIRQIWNNVGNVSLQSLWSDGVGETVATIGRIRVTSNKFQLSGVSSSGNSTTINGVTIDRRVYDFNLIGGCVRLENLGDGATRLSLLLIRNNSFETIHECIVQPGDTFSQEDWGLSVENGN